MIRSLLIAAALTCVGAASAAPVPNPAGSFDLVDGDVRIIDSAKRGRPAKVGDVVVEGDSIESGVGAEAHLAMEDGGQLGVRPNTRLRIVQYKAEGGADDRSVVSLLEGTLRSLSGWIGKFNAKNYAIRTPTATIGVRGTDHETTVIAADRGDGEPGTYDKVNDGATVLTTARGSTEVRPNQAGFVPRSGSQAPRLLDRIPAFFRPARNDKRFDGLHATLSGRLDRVRDDRLRLVRERRGDFEARKRDIFQQREERMRTFQAERRTRADGERRRPVAEERRRRSETNHTQRDFARRSPAKARDDLAGERRKRLDEGRLPPRHDESRRRPDATGGGRHLAAPGRGDRP